MDEVTAHAPAKINLALHVTGRRPDGYHEIETLVAFTRFGDRVAVASAAETSFAITGPFAAGLPADGTNLVMRALAALRDAYPEQTQRPLSITLEKNLPIASGVGGGSSNAAAALHALSAFWELDLTDAELSRIAAPLGADLPMCLAARPLVARGIGEKLSPAGGFPALGLVLVNPNLPVSTAQVFRALARHDGQGLPPLPRAIDFHSLREWLDGTRNDLEPVARAIQPAIDVALRALVRAGAGFARMSGSGATCFALFDSEAARDLAADAVPREWWRMATHLR